MDYVFEWDEEKNARNIAKHGVSFNTAEKAFTDPFKKEVFDWKHSISEERWKTIGFAGWELLRVIFTERNKKIRLISAQKADKEDKEEYYGNSSACSRYQ